MAHISLSQAQDIAGFVIENVEKGKQAKVLTKASLISDQPEFYKYIEHISNMFLNKAGVFIDKFFSS